MDIRLEDVVVSLQLMTVYAYLAAKATSLDAQKRMPFRASRGGVLSRRSVKGAR